MLETVLFQVARWVLLLDPTGVGGDPSRTHCGTLASHFADKVLAQLGWIVEGMP